MVAYPAKCTLIKDNSRKRVGLHMSAREWLIPKTYKAKRSINLSTYLVGTRGRLYDCRNVNCLVNQVVIRASAYLLRTLNQVKLFIISSFLELLSKLQP